MGDIYSIIYGAVGGGVTGVIAAILGGIAIAYFNGRADPRCSVRAFGRFRSGLPAYGCVLAP